MEGVRFIGVVFRVVWVPGGGIREVMLKCWGGLARHGKGVWDGLLLAVLGKVNKL